MYFITGVGSLLGDQHSLLSKDLQSIPSVTCGVVNMEYEDTRLPYDVSLAQFSLDDKK